MHFRALLKKCLGFWVIVIAFVLALLAKYLWTLFVFPVPLGYDAGIYRYLFIRHAAGFPPFAVAPMDAWALEHPLGLFTITTLLLRLGLPVDWLIGWIWNLVPVIVAILTSLVFTRRNDRIVGVLVLLMFLLSLAQFYGVIAMYWKTFASLLFAVLAFDAYERKSKLWACFAATAVAIHHQTGLLVLLSLGTVFSVDGLRAMRSGRGTQFLLSIGVFAVCLFLIGLWYLPVWNAAIVPHVQSLLQSFSSATPSGSFPDLSVIAAYSCVLWLFGIVGVWVDVRARPWSPWHFAVLWSMIAVLVRIFFYKRFLLHLDFFLLPFAAIGLVALWNTSLLIVRGLLGATLVAQGAMTTLLVLPNGQGCALLPTACFLSPPRIEAAADVQLLADLKRVSPSLERDALVLSLEPTSVPWILGWLPWQRVAGPGVFSSPWDEAGWSKVILGTSEDRAMLFRPLPHPLYLYISDFFRNYYGSSVQSLLSDPCLSPGPMPDLYRWSCPSG